MSLVNNNMKVEYKTGTITLDLHELLQSVSPETKQELIESLSCDDDIIRHVSEQIISGWTDNMYCGSSACTANPDPTLPLDKARREIAKHAGEIAKKQIEELESALAQSKKLTSELYDEIRELRHSQKPRYW